MSQGRAGPVFVLGAPYSGNAALAWSLAQSPRIHHVAGATWLTDLCASLAAVERVGRQVKGRGASITSVGHLVQWDVGPGQFWGTFGRGVDSLLAPPATKGQVAGPRIARLLGNRRRPGPRRRWMSAESELHGVVHGLNLLFPDAQYLHVVRRPETAIAAMTASSRANPQPLDRRAAAKEWVAAVRNGLDAERALGAAVYRVDYERLALEPEGTVRECLAFLGIRWDPACVRVVAGSPARLLIGTDPALLHHLPEAQEISDLVQELSRQTPPAPLTPTEARARLSDCLLAQAGVRKKGPEVPARVKAVRDLVGSCVPRSARALVVSRGQDELLEIEGVEAQHFPQTAGSIYAGHHPGSSDEAIDQLEDLRKRGAEYLVVPRSSFWWFDYYGYLREYLLTRFRLVGYQPDVGVVFNLASPPGAGELFSVRYSDREAGQQYGRYAATNSRPQQELGRRFDAATDRFLVAGAGAAALFPDGWPVREIAGLRVCTHPALPVRELVDRAGTELGLILGHAIGLFPQTPGRGPVRLDCMATEGLDRLEQELYRLTGRYACLVSAAGSNRFYLDAGGTLGSVYSADAGVIASTIDLLEAIQFGSDRGRRASGASAAEGRTEHFPAGLTRLPWAHRLLPNHYLSLDTWTAHRHWPPGDLETVDELGLAEQLYEISTGLNASMGALGREVDWYLGLTAGRSSRTLLACARGLTDAPTAATFDYGTGASDRAMEMHVARELARIAGVPHVTVPAGDAGMEQGDPSWVRAGPRANGDVERDGHAPGKALKPGRAWVLGLFGELGRGCHWGELEGVSSLEPEALLDRMGLPQSERLSEAVGLWLAGLPRVSPRLLLDLFYLENRGGCHAGAYLYGIGSFEAIVAPFASRRVVEAMLRLPEEYRARRRLYRDLIVLRWPELLQVPFGGLD